VSRLMSLRDIYDTTATAPPPCAPSSTATAPARQVSRTAPNSTAWKPGNATRPTSAPATAATSHDSLSAASTCRHDDLCDTGCANRPGARPTRHATQLGGAMCAIRICSYAPAPGKEHCAALPHGARQEHPRRLLHPHRRRRPPPIAPKPATAATPIPSAERSSHQRRGSIRRYSTTASAVHAATPPQPPRWQPRPLTP